MEIKYSITDEVVFFNPMSGKLETAEIKSIRVVPTGISKDKQGKNVLDGCVVLYDTVNGPTLAEREVFLDKETAKAELLKIVEGL